MPEKGGEARSGAEGLAANGFTSFFTFFSPLVFDFPLLCWAAFR
jgi:hypothetical protein